MKIESAYAQTGDAVGHAPLAAFTKGLNRKI
jgi:hypothetical protein